MIKVVKIEQLGEYRLCFNFDDDSLGEYDFSALLSENGPMIEPLRDPAYFSRVFLEHGAPTWPNGFDVSPSWLHRELAVARALKRQASV